MVSCGVTHRLCVFPASQLRHAKPRENDIAKTTCACVIRTAAPEPCTLYDGKVDSFKPDRGLSVIFIITCHRASFGRCDESASERGLQAAHSDTTTPTELLRVLGSSCEPESPRTTLGENSNSCLRDLSCRVDVTQTCECVCLAADRVSHCFSQHVQ